MADDFKRIVESLKVPFAVVEADGTIRLANAAFAQLSGERAGSLAGTPFAGLFPPSDGKRVLQAIQRVGEGKIAYASIDTSLGGPVHVALQPMLDARDKAAGVIAVLTDTAAQHETEQTANLFAARLLALAEASPAAAMVENAEGEIELANEAFCRLLGLDSAPQSLTGVTVDDAMARSKMDAKARKAKLERQPIVVDDEEAGAVWTARQQGPAPEAGTKGAAEIALIEKIGMELSIAMEGISAITIRAQQMEFDPVLIDHFQRIRSSTETAMAAIGDLVDFSKLTGTGVILHKGPFELRPLLADLIARLAPNAEEHHCRLRIKVEQDVSDSLDGDVERLLLVLKNLLDNAFAMMPGSEITLQITPEYVTESGIQLSFSVTAAGEGAQHAVAADQGMGVAVAKFMVGAMGGKLAVASRSSADALYSFTIEFPVRPAPAAPPRPTYVSLVGLPVLLVSADPDQRLALSNLLRGWRMTPLEADNAPMAIALLDRMQEERSPVPLVILSNRLPGQDGFLLAFRIKHHRHHRQTLVMMLASEGRPGDAIACRENGISAYMRYPIGDKQLNEAIVAVTGASVDSDETPTLVTRHSLREHRKGATILLVDPSRDSQILAAHILGRQDCSIVVAQDLQEAFAALDQDMYDFVLVDTTLPGLGGDDAGKTLRAHIARDAESVTIVATSLDHSPKFREAKLEAGFNTTLAKPFRKDDLLGLLASRGRVAAEA